MTTSQQRLQELQQMSFEDLLQLKTPQSEDELRLIQKRVEEEEERLERIEKLGSVAMVAVREEREQLRRDSEKLARVDQILAEQQRLFDELDAKNRELDARANAMAENLASLRARQAGLRGAESTLDSRVTNHLLGICDRLATGAGQTEVVARQDDRDYFVSLSDVDGTVLCEQFLPKEWVSL